MSEPFLVLLEIDPEEISFDPWDVATWLATLEGVKDVTVWPATTNNPQIIWEVCGLGQCKHWPLIEAVEER